MSRSIGVLILPFVTTFATYDPVCYECVLVITQTMFKRKCKQWPGTVTAKTQKFASFNLSMIELSLITNNLDYLMHLRRNDIYIDVLLFV